MYTNRKVAGKSPEFLGAGFLFCSPRTGSKSLGRKEAHRVVLLKENWERILRIAEI